MKKILLTAFFAAFLAGLAMSQDEGTVVKRERIQRDKGIFVGGGLSIPGGSNFGDYSTGINFEAGYLKRLNRVFSIGGSLSYLSFKYSPKNYSAAGYPDNFYYDSGNDDGYALNLKGGDLSVISLALNLKFNFIPVKDDSKISVYGFAKPFIASSTRSDVNGTGQYWYDSGTGFQRDATSDVDWGKDGYPVLGQQTKTTGGIFIGPGIEFNPGKAISIFVQASFGYTFPINIVSTKSYGHDISDYANDQFPMKDLGFTSINFSGGVSFNLN